MFLEDRNMIVFKSKIDLWLLLTLFFSIAVSIATAYVTFKQSGTVNIVIAVIILVFGGGLPAWLFSGTKYVVSDDNLRVSCGPFSWSIPVSEITSVSETRNPLSSPALSLDRLELSYTHGKSIMLSPSDKQAFREAIGHPET
ncbi:PH domain-containing protein [Congregibacter sp.]|uniref:PH domain-containing protein n=1 Tax=Congregibacter sp. TaxID=2744308 RepID=UPI00385A483D